MKTILLVEDNLRYAELVRRILEPHGYTLVHAPDGASGLRLAADERPDLILLDLGLPDIAGQTLIGLVRRVPGMDQAPVVAVTAWPAEQGEPMARAYGCTGYIAKPIDVLEFPARVAAYLT
jgi:two-component system cell cycle response regulator DivK